MSKYISKAEVRETFKKHYLKTSDRAEAWNATLLELGGRGPSDERIVIADILREEVDDLVKKLRGKVKHKVVTYDVHGLDVWGNAREGFEVNDVYPSRGQVEIPEDASHEEIVRALKAEGFIDRNIHMSSVEIDGEPGYTLYIGEARTNKPVYELRVAD